MNNLYTRAFCRPCRLQFEYALTDAEVTDNVIVRCPRCDRPARHGPLQPCDQARHAGIEAQYERLARQAEAEQATKRSKDRRRHRDNGDAEFQFDRKHRKRPK